MHETVRRDALSEKIKEIRERIHIQLKSMNTGADRAESSPGDVSAGIRRSLANLESSLATTLESLPPQPPTMRGRVGAAIERILQRALFWQYAQARANQRALINHLKDIASALAQLETVAISRMELLERLDREVERSTEELRRLDRSVTKVENRLAALDEQLPRPETST